MMIRKTKNTSTSEKMNSPRKGVAIVLVTVCFTIIVAAVALAVDLGHIILAEAQLQNAADSASLSAARALKNGEQDAINAAKYWALENVTAGQNVVVSDSDIELGIWDIDLAEFQSIPIGSSEEPNAVRVTCRRTQANNNPVSLFIAPFFGTDFADIVCSSIASLPYDPKKASFQFLIDEEMIDKDIDSIEEFAEDNGVDGDEYVYDWNGDGFLDFPGGTKLWLPTGQVGDEGLFDIQSYAGQFPFRSDTVYTVVDFLAGGTDLQDILDTTELQDREWTRSQAPHQDLKGYKVLDYVLGIDPVSEHSRIHNLVDPAMLHVAKVFKSDVSLQEDDPSKYGSPAANLQGESRGLMAFRIINSSPNPDGGSYLPYLKIEIVDPSGIDIRDLNEVIPGESSNGEIAPTIVR